MVVIGIAGGSASGKSTVSAALQVRLGERASILHHDRYYLSPPPDLPPQRWNYDHPDSLETSLLVEHLRELKAGRVISAPRYDFANHRREEGVDRIEPREVLFVEGILVLAVPELRRQLDRKVFVACESDLRLLRRLRRDISERGRDALGVLDQYEQTVRPMHACYVYPSRVHADLVLDGARPVAESVERVLELIQAV
ncbi:MAG: uridine kinase [Deltaproteobacteria bacterium]|nr:MAG: uridine kinase [Deltaproteobacteria bacterium]